MLIAVSFLVPLPKTKVMAATITQLPFGGIIIYAMPCTCNAPNWGVKVGPPVGGDFIYIPGSTWLFSEYQIFRPGPWVLGMAGGSAPCMQYEGTSCANDKVVPQGRVMTMVGTSY